MKKSKYNKSLREAIRSIISEMDFGPNVSTSDSLENLKNYVEDNIDLTGYGDFENVSKNNKLKSVVEIFRDEKGWDIKNQGEKRAFIDYLRGMPSLLDIATYYNEIKSLMYALGYDDVKDMDDEEIDKLYYDELYKVFFKH